MRFWIAGLLACLLGGCFTSETPRIPVEELSRPEGLAGQYWYLSLQNDSGLSAYLVEIASREDGGFEQSRGDAGRFRLVDLAGGKAFLFISDEAGGDEKEEKTSTYYLLQRREGGAWEWDDISVAYAGPFAEQNVAYLAQVASRHGLTLGSPDERTRITGQVHGLAMPQLFRDPAFLGALRVTPMGTYLPVRPGLAESGGIRIPQSLRVRFEMELAAPMPASPLFVRPEGVAGSYVLSGAEFETGTLARIEARADGRFDLHIGAQDATIALLPFDESEGIFIGIRDSDIASGDGTTHHTGLLVLGRTPDGWEMSSIEARASTGCEEIDAMLAKLVGEAAQRHGLKLEEGKIAGAIDAARLLALLHDGQFTSGLALEDQPPLGPVRFIRQPAGP